MWRASDSKKKRGVGEGRRGYGKEEEGGGGKEVKEKKNVTDGEGRA